MKKIILLTLFGTLFTLNLHCQTDVDSEIRDFIITTEKSEKFPQLSIYAYEVVSNEEWNIKAYKGIYRIGGFIDHSYTHLLFIDGRKKYFIDTYKTTDIDVLKQILSLFEKSEYKYTDREKLLYIEDVLYILEENKDRIPW